MSKYSSVGIITYDSYHLKTEQIVHRLIDSKNFDDIKLFALPFKERKARNVIIEHRPNQSKAIHTKSLAMANSLDYVYWDGLSELKGCDIYLIAGAGILSPKAIKGNKIINAHGGIIPNVRGLDSFKWAIHYGRDIGITLHYIDENVDDGKIIYIKKTPIYYDDSILTLARRHYELEIDLLSNFQKYIDININYDYKKNESKMRMPKDLEKDLEERFKDYKILRNINNAQ